MLKPISECQTAPEIHSEVIDSSHCSMPIPTKILRSSWSSTLCLPKSTFPPRATLEDQKKYLRRCTDDLYALTQQRPPSAFRQGEFILHDGPPYANGDLHIGHALNKILKDIICRYQLSRGKRVKYTPGWDCHGLPIELKAIERQKEIGLLGQDRQLDAIGIRKAARELATQTVKKQRDGFRSWGIMADWDNAWTTMDPKFELAQLDVFKGMVEKGLIYRRFKPVYWSPSSRTALAEAELEYEENHTSTAAYVKFPLISVSSIAAQLLDVDWRKVSAVIWTTTPWTLPANRAIAVHSDMEYVVVKSDNHGLMLLAKVMLAHTEQMCGEDLSKISATPIRGSDLVGTVYQNPIHDTASHSRILHADFVKGTSGTGLVHVAPGHGMDDYNLGLEHGLNVFAPVDDMGCFTKEVLPSRHDLLAGKAVLDEGNATVLELLGERKALAAAHKHIHKYPYDWRSKQPVIVRATEQWFADVGELRDPALRSLKAVRFIPESSKERLSSFVQRRSEWCISRQRVWGVPIPALYHKETGSALLTKESIKHIISVIRDRGTDAWWTDEEHDPAWTAPALRQDSGTTHYRRGKDTMDVWFDSGTSWTHIEQQECSPLMKALSDHQRTTRPSSMNTENEKSKPRVADVYLEGTDQHRGWFQSSLLTSISQQDASIDGVTMPIAPYKTLVTHGFTLDQNGRKMSKSEGNVISPDQIMGGSLLPPTKSKKLKGRPNMSQSPSHDAMGPDALRLWVAGCDYTKDVIVGEAVLQTIHNSLSKLRVTFRLLIGLMNNLVLCGNNAAIRNFGIIDRIALIQVYKLVERVHQFNENYEFFKSVSAINQYVNSELSAFYIESIKDRMYADAPRSQSRMLAGVVLWHIYKGLSSILEPITPLLVEEAASYMYQGGLLDVPMMHQQKADSYKDRIIKCTQPDAQQTKDITLLFSASSAIKHAQEAARRDKHMGSSLESYVFFEVQCTAGEKSREAASELFGKHLAEMEDFFVVSSVNYGLGDIPSFVRDAKWRYTSSFMVDQEEVIVHVYAPAEDKCVRCWKYTVPRESKLEEALCLRCVGVLEGMREEKAEVFKERPQLSAAASACRSESHAEKLRDHWDFS